MASNLLIGGGGYFGLELAYASLKNNEMTMIIDPLIYGNYDKIPEQSDNFIFVNDDVLNIENYFTEQYYYENIFYLASPRLSDVNSIDIVNEEVERLRKTIEIVKKYKNESTNFYFFSSCSVYGKNSEIVNENSELIETSLYSKLKIECEKVIQQEDERFRIFRMATIFGNATFERDDILINSIIKDIKLGNTIEIFDPEAARPHIDIRDAVEVVKYLVAQRPTDKIINVGPEDANHSKREIIEKTKYLLGFDFDVKYIESNDSRDYRVNFDLLNKTYLGHHWHHTYYTFSESIFDLYVGKMNFSKEEYDSILKHSRPNGSSASWYLEEEGKISIPKMWGNWNIIDDTNNSLFGYGFLKQQIHPPFRSENVIWKSKEEIKNDKHIYLITCYNPMFFELNREIGFKCISPKYIRDIREGRAKIVIYHALEGYSGSKGNTDLEIIDKWIQDIGIPHKSVYYIHGNLLIDDIIQKKGLKFKGIGFNEFDIWLDYKQMPSHSVKFNVKDSKYLYLSYNRNLTRGHRIKFCATLMDSNLLNDGKISVGNFDLHQHRDNHPSSDKLHSLTPIEIDKTIDYNLANDITFDNYESTFVSIVTESLVFEDTLFISEKTWKPIYVGHPFIIYGNRHTLKYLKSLGYKTFDKWWDESYDDEIDDNIRLSKIVKIIEELKKIHPEKLIQMREEMVELLEWNQHIYRMMIRQRYNLNDRHYISEVPMTKMLADIYYDKI